MKTVSAREANQHFSKLLAEVEAGREVIITKYGKPVAKLGRVTPKEDTPERRAAIEKMIARMQQGYDLGGVKIDREEIYDRPSLREK